MAQGEGVLREWLSQLAGYGKAPSKLDKSLRSCDVLIVCDMQNDMVSGRAAVPEAREVERAVVSLVNRASSIGCKIIAVRSYHPAGHRNFQSDRDEYAFPPYCLAGTVGSYFTTDVGDALTDALQLGIERKEKAVHVCFKGIREDLRTFSAFPYSLKLAGQRIGLHDVSQMDESLLEFTGSFELKCSCLEQNINASPDMRAVINRTPITELLWGTPETSRVFICGLPLDFSVIDTACCANVAGKSPYVVVDATRPVHISPGERSAVPPGFVSSIEDHAKLLHNYKVRLCFASDVLSGK